MQENTIPEGLTAIIIILKFNGTKVIYPQNGRIADFLEMVDCGRRKEAIGGGRGHIRSNK